MALIAEAIVEEWLNRMGYFTIRGVRLGNQEMDLLAVRVSTTGIVERRHLEVQASSRPVSYITPLAAAIRAQTKESAGNARLRSDAELHLSVQEWLEKKYAHSRKVDVLQRLCAGVWTRELVVNVARHEAEVAAIAAAGVRIHRLRDIVSDLGAGQTLVPGAAGADLVELVNLSREIA